MTSPNPDEADWTELVEIALKDGSTITMRRVDSGGLELCHDTACLNIPATAPEFLGLLEFFQTLSNGVKDA